ncbi:MAG: hypothetical protein NT133_18395 [Alphaproteobacteria bacterium]|nr:hypothetical protein [Alphaproteobacteria bacterium]
MVLLTGCANFNMLDRRTPLTPGGTAIHLDAPQRLVFTNRKGEVCAEPTPDALQAYASALGAGVSAPSQGAASIAGALQTSSGSIGLHTQSITLMRDNLYRICEAGYNGQLNNTDIVQMLQRSQDLTLGVLAIEQLTGAVKAPQLRLGGNAQASASASAADASKVLANARETEAIRTKSLEAVRTLRSGDQIASETAAQAVIDFTPNPPTSDSDKRRLADLNQKSASLKAKVEQDIIDVTNAEKNLADASAVVLKAQEALSTALSSSSASASGSGEFTVVSDHKNIEKDTAKELAHAVTEIVENIVNHSRLLEVCANLMSRSYASLSDKEREDERLAFVPFMKEECSKVFAANLKTIADRDNTKQTQAIAAKANAEARLKEASAKGATKVPPTAQAPAPKITP